MDKRQVLSKAEAAKVICEPLPRAKERGIEQGVALAWVTIGLSTLLAWVIALGGI